MGVINGAFCDVNKAEEEGLIIYRGDINVAHWDTKLQCWLMSQKHNNVSSLEMLTLACTPDRSYSTINTHCVCCV